MTSIVLESLMFLRPVIKTEERADVWDQNFEAISDARPSKFVLTLSLKRGQFSDPMVTILMVTV